MHQTAFLTGTGALSSIRTVVGSGNAIISMTTYPLDMLRGGVTLINNLGWSRFGSCGNFIGSGFGYGMGGMTFLGSSGGLRRSSPSF